MSHARFFPKPNLTTVLAAFLSAAAILAGTLLLAEQLSQSRIYRQSQVYRSIASQDQLDLLQVVRDGEMRELMVHFAAAVTNAYVSFEMIPYNEGQTFVAVLQSLSGEVQISQFAYRRRNLVIEGDASGPEAYQHFVRSLRNTGHFQSVSGHSYLTVEDKVRFEIECLPGQQGAISLPAAIAGGGQIPKP